ncbi:hypothetical protein glysoja_044111, partial [Glycine soja]
FESVVRQTWSKSAPTIPRKLSIVKEDLKFNKQVFGNIFRSKKVVEACLKGVQHKLDWYDSESLKRLEKKLQEEYNDILLQEEFVWFKKSCEKWVHFGIETLVFSMLI